jgi:4-hydroxy-3-methylbut-2-enyl diphosphate reductase
MSWRDEVFPLGVVGGLRRGTVLVADEVRYPGGLVLPCPAAVLVAAELRRVGISTTRGTLAVPSGVPEGTASGAVACVAASDAIDAGHGGEPVAMAVAAGDEPCWTAARAAVAGWVAVAGSRRVVLASPRSWCAGVVRAVEIVERALARWGAPVYVRRQIVHNSRVVADLASRGVVFVDEVDEVPAGAVVVYSAHGVSPAVRAEAATLGLRVVDATCPLVTKVHAEARRFTARGDTVILVGHAGHEEVEGTLGEAPGRMVLVQTVDDARDVWVADPERVSYLTQTTLAVEETAEIVDVLRARFPALRGPGSDDICYATTNRQHAVTAVVERSDLVLVIGSANSSNSVRLVETARSRGVPAELIDDAGDIRPRWLAGVETVGLTAGASAPDQLVGEVIDALSGLGPVTVTEHETTRESQHFALPAAVRT